MPDLTKTIDKKTGKRGVAALPTILMLSGIVGELVLSGVLLSFLFSRSGLAGRLSAEASALARSGAEDAIYRIVKDDYQTPYTLDLGNGRKADILIEKDPVDLVPSCGVSWGCRYRVTSSGRALSSNRETVIILGADPLSREIKIQSIK
jgi:hypothetical protein